MNWIENYLLPFKYRLSGLIFVSHVFNEKKCFPGRDVQEESIDQSKPDVEWEDEAVMISSISSSHAPPTNEVGQRVDKNNLYSLVSNELLLSAQHDHVEETLVGTDDDKPINYNDFDVNTNTDDENEDDDDDVLSTITEATEPEQAYTQSLTDSVPFAEKLFSSTDSHKQNSSKNLEERNVSLTQQNLSDEVPSSPKLLLPSDIHVHHPPPLDENNLRLHCAPSTTKLLLPSDLRTPKPSLDLNCETMTSSRSIVSSTADTSSFQRASYVIDERSVEHAMASGIPVISNEPDVKNTRSGNRPYRELLNASREISAMQSERVRPSVEVSRDSKLVGNLLKSSRVMEQEQKNVDHSALLDQNKQLNSYSNVGDKEPEVKTSTLLTKQNSELNTDQNNGLENRLMNSLETGKTNSLADLQGKSVQKDKSDVKYRDIFHSVSYNHWPFVQKDTKDMITLIKDGRQVVYEKLNANEKSGYTSWSDLSAKRNTTTTKTSAISLEERENRLRNVNEIHVLVYLFTIYKIVEVLQITRRRALTKDWIHKTS